MTAGKLLELLKLYLDNGQIKDDAPVIITLSDSSVGARAGVGVETIAMGFDWEHGQLRIEPKEKIFRNIQRIKEPVGIVRESFGGVELNACGRCHRKVAEYDRYCRHCGQRLK